MQIENACCPKIHIENAIFLCAILTAIQKCKMDSGKPTFLIYRVSPKAVRFFLPSVFLFFRMRGMMQRLSEFKNLPKNITQTSQTMA